VLYWAQSKTHIYLDAKFSHMAADSEPCLKLDDLKIDFESERLKLAGICNMHGKKVKYLLNIPLNGPIQPSESSYLVLTGHAELTLAKAQAGQVWKDVSDRKQGVVEKWWRKQRLIDTFAEL